MQVWCSVCVCVCVARVCILCKYAQICYSVSTAQFVEERVTLKMLSKYDDLRKQELKREETGSGQANPTSTEAVEAVVQGLKNNYLTFKDRSRGIRREQK